MRAFWDQDQGGRNFGDALTAVLFEHMLGVRLEWSEPEAADVFGVGSLAEAIPVGFTGIVFGTGKMFAHTALDLSQARVLALRGPLTAEDSGADCDLLGDPGLLVRDLPWGKVAPRDLGTAWLPHYVDERSGVGYRIDILGGVPAVLDEVARCERIVTSSLHGLVLADAFGIPSLWDPCPAVAGEGFKFRDYAASYGETIRPGVWRMAPPDQVMRKHDALLAALLSLDLAVAA